MLHNTRHGLLGMPVAPGPANDGAHRTRARAACMYLMRAPKMALMSRTPAVSVRRSPCAEHVNSYIAADCATVLRAASVRSHSSWARSGCTTQPVASPTPKQLASENMSLRIARFEAAENALAPNSLETRSCGAQSNLTSKTTINTSEAMCQHKPERGGPEHRHAQPHNCVNETWPKSAPAAVAIPT